MVVASSVAVSAASASNAQPSFETSRHAASSRTVAAGPAPGAGPSSASARDAPAADAEASPETSAAETFSISATRASPSATRACSRSASASRSASTSASHVSGVVNGAFLPFLPEDARNRTTPAASTTPRSREPLACASASREGAGFDPRGRGRFVVVVIARPAR